MTSSKVHRFEVSVEADENVQSETIAGILRNHLYFAFWDTREGWVNWQKTVRVRPLET